jgi:hypothetical protein
VVECDLAKVEVASSNLVSRSKIQKGEGRKEKSLSYLPGFTGSGGNDQVHCPNRAAFFSFIRAFIFFKHPT